MATNKRPSARKASGATTKRGTVRSHTRTVNGKKVQVTQHKRGTLSPGRAGRNAARAFKAARRKRHWAALGLAGLATAELAGWLTLRGSAIGLTVLGVGLVGIGLAARSLAR